MSTSDRALFVLLVALAVALAALAGSARAGDAPTPPPLPPLRIVFEHLPDARLGQRYLIDLAATGGDGPDRWRADARLPQGLHLTVDGRLWGTPRHEGVFTLPLTVVAGAQRATKDLYLDVEPPRG